MTPNKFASNYQATVALGSKVQRKKFSNFCLWVPKSAKNKKPVGGSRPSKHIMASAPSSPLTAASFLPNFRPGSLLDQKLKKKKRKKILPVGNKTSPKKKKTK